MSDQSEKTARRQAVVAINRIVQAAKSLAEAEAILLNANKPKRKPKNKEPGK